jgi:hypothetical protein
MTNERHAQIRVRLREMTCKRVSAPIDLYFVGWGPNEDGTKTFWCVGPGLQLVEGTTLHADADVADFETLHEFLGMVTSDHESMANDLMR